MNNCLNCKKETKNPKYCSRSCSASNNNKLFPKRKPESNCKTCRQPITSNLTYCKSCHNDKFVIDWSKVTYGEVTGTRNYQKNSRIRDLARSLYFKKYASAKCLNCGYDKHIEVCHIKGISSFNYDTVVSKINSYDNLIGLCRNCHWELDNNFLSLEDINNNKT